MTCAGVTPLLPTMKATQCLCGCSSHSPRYCQGQGIHSTVPDRLALRQRWKDYRANAGPVGGHLEARGVEMQSQVAAAGGHLRPGRPPVNVTLGE